MTDSSANLVIILINVLQHVPLIILQPIYKMKRRAGHNLTSHVVLVQKKIFGCLPRVTRDSASKSTRISTYTT